MEKIKDVEVWQIILHDLHDVMYMSIEPKENIETFKEWERMKVLQSFEQHSLMTLAHITFGPIIANFGMCSFSISIFQNMFFQWS